MKQIFRNSNQNNRNKNSDTQDLRGNPKREKTTGGNTDIKSTIIWVSIKRSHPQCRDQQQERHRSQTPKKEINYNENLSILTPNKSGIEKGSAKRHPQVAPHQIRLNNLVFIGKPHRYQEFNPSHKQMSWPPIIIFPKRKKSSTQSMEII